MDILSSSCIVCLICSTETVIIGKDKGKTLQVSCPKPRWHILNNPNCMLNGVVEIGALSAGLNDFKDSEMVTLIVSISA